MSDYIKVKSGDIKIYQPFEVAGFGIINSGSKWKVIYYIYDVDGLFDIPDRRKFKTEQDAVDYVNKRLASAPSKIVDEPIIVKAKGFDFRIAKADGE